MDPVLLAIQMGLQILVPALTATIKNPKSVAQLKSMIPVIDTAIAGLTQLRNSITSKARKK